jgi:membrane protease subunit (stomatin/prohibitin family)
MTDIEKLVKLLDDFNRNLSTVAGNEKYVIWDDHVELAKYLLANDVAQAVKAKWQKQWCDGSMIGHMYEECPICGCMILDTEKFWDCKFCPNCGAEMLGD